MTLFQGLETWWSARPKKFRTNSTAFVDGGRSVIAALGSGIGSARRCALEGDQAAAAVVDKPGRDSWSKRCWLNASHILSTGSAHCFSPGQSTGPRLAAPETESLRKAYGSRVRGRARSPLKEHGGASRFSGGNHRRLRERAVGWYRAWRAIFLDALDCVVEIAALSSTFGNWRHRLAK